MGVELKEHLFIVNCKTDGDYPNHITLQMTPHNALNLIQRLAAHLEEKSDLIEISLVGEMIRLTKVDNPTR